MTEVRPQQGELFSETLRRFMKAVRRCGVLHEARQRMHFEPKRERRRMRHQRMLAKREKE